MANYRCLQTFEQGMPSTFGGVFKLHHGKVYAVAKIEATQDVPAHYVITTERDGKPVNRMVPRKLFESFVSGRLLEPLPEA